MADWSTPETAYRSFRRYFEERGFDVEAAEGAAVSHTSNFSPHSAEALRFMCEIVGLTGHWMAELQEGVKLEFSSQPGPYKEPNNRSANENNVFVQNTVSEWEAAGYIVAVDQPPWCTSPLSVAQKYDPVADVLKDRLVLDLSRHVNKFIVTKSTKLDDLSVSEHLLEPDDFMTSFDLKNQFFHVKLHPDMYRYFGFAVKNNLGVEKYYYFKVLVYGCKPAVYIVTRLLAPVKSYLHNAGVKLSLYVDDGRVAAASISETEAKTKLSLLVVQLAGWNLQWKKCKLEPSQALLHLGFVTNTQSMTYTVPVEKIVLLKSLIAVVCQKYFDNLYVPVRMLATVLGKVNSMFRSHGSILHVMSRSSQHVLGSHVLLHGWNSHLRISPQIVTELSFISSHLEQGNGQPIFTAAAYSHTVELKDIAKIAENVRHQDCDIANLFVSDASATHAFVYRADGSFEYVRDFEFSEEQRCGSSGHRELLAIKQALEADPHVFAQFRGGKVFWQTDSRNCFTFLRRGSRVPSIQQDVVKIKQMERSLQILIIPVWTTREQSRLILADLGSKFSNSTDEWSVDRQILQTVFSHFRFVPTVDCFASQHNTVCSKYFSMVPQTNSAGVNFFAQSLHSQEKYFVCPPVSLILPAFKKLCSVASLEALFLIPEWKSSVFWPFLFNGVARQPQIRDVFRFPASFSFSNQASSHVFSRHPNFHMLALHIVTM